MDTEREWFISRPGGLHSGPFAVAEVIDEIRCGTANGATLCWRDGMERWEPLSRVPPFAGYLRRRMARRAFAVAAVIAVAVGGWFLYAAWRGPAEVRRADGLIRAGEYAQAAALLDAFLARHPDNADAGFFRAVAGVHAVVAANADAPAILAATPGGDESVRAAADALRRALSVEPWRKADAVAALAEIWQRVPESAPDAAERLMALGCIRVDLGLADPAWVAREWLARTATARSGTPSGRFNDHTLPVLLNWSPSCAGDVIRETLATRADAPAADLRPLLASVTRAAGTNRTLRLAVADAMEKAADESAARGGYEAADALLQGARDADPSRGPAIAGKQLAVLQKRLAAGDAAGVLRALASMGDWASPYTNEVFLLCLGASQRLAAAEPEASADALDRALRLQPDWPRLNDENALVVIGLMTRPAADKLQRCQDFLADFPKSPRRDEVLLAVLDDAAKFFDQCPRAEPSQAAPYLEAGRAACLELLGSHPDAASLDNKAMGLATRLAQTGDAGRQESSALLEALLQKKPGTPRRREMEQAVASWTGRKSQPVPSPGPTPIPVPAPNPVPVPAPPADRATERARAICGDLAADPGNKEKMILLRTAVPGIRDAATAARYEAIYALGCLCASNFQGFVSSTNRLQGSPAGREQLKVLVRLCAPCPQCGGAGVIRQRCVACNGSGRCNHCGGSGWFEYKISKTRMACPKCGKTGRCAACAGQGSSAVPCVACGVLGYTAAQPEARLIYLSMLRNEQTGSAGQR